MYVGAENRWLRSVDSKNTTLHLGSHHITLGRNRLIFGLSDLTRKQIKASKEDGSEGILRKWTLSVRLYSFCAAESMYGQEAD